MFRIGLGNDIHRLVAGRPLILGGVRIESELGADGHSDADVLTHAITDAILGALALGDIGTYFPSNEDRWRNAESFVFLRYAVGLMRERGFMISNVDATISLEKTRLREHIDRIRESLAPALETRPENISVKAKTGEGIDAVGKSEAIRADVVVLLQAHPQVR